MDIGASSVRKRIALLAGAIQNVKMQHNALEENMIFDTIQWCDGIWVINSECEFIVKDSNVKFSNHIFMIVVREKGKTEHLLNIDIGGENDLDFIAHQLNKAKAKYPNLPIVDATALHYDKENAKYIYTKPMFENIADKIYLFYPKTSEYPLAEGETYDYFVEYTGHAPEEYFK